MKMHTQKRRPGLPLQGGHGISTFCQQEIGKWYSLLKVGGDCTARVCSPVAKRDSGAGGNGFSELSLGPAARENSTG